MVTRFFVRTGFVDCTGSGILIVRLSYLLCSTQSLISPWMKPMVDLVLDTTCADATQCFVRKSGFDSGGDMDSGGCEGFLGHYARIGGVLLPRLSISFWRCIVRT